MGKTLTLCLLVGLLSSAGCDDADKQSNSNVDAVPRADGSIDMMPPMPDEGPNRPDTGGMPDRGVVDAVVADMAVQPDLGPALPACSDGADNDADGVIDDADPGCTGPDDDDETDPPRLCGNGVDDDGDGFIDLDDPGCESDQDFTEEDPARRPACANGRDDDADGLIDLADPGCQGAGDADEEDPALPAACGNGDDDDNDGLIDFPNDPGCGGPGDTSEADPAVLPACGNTLDDDGDGTIDYPADLGCASAGDHDERLLCVTGHELGDLNAAMANDGYAEGTTAGALATQRGACGGDAGGEAMFFYRVEERLARVVFSTVHPETVAPTVLYVRQTCEAAEDLACNRGSADVPGTEAILERPEPGTYVVVVDTSSRMIGPGAFRLTATEEALPVCDDQLDNDGDGDVDFPNDPGCMDANGDDETDPDPVPACGDGIDNDGDEAIDFPLDPDCESAADDSEAQVGCMGFANLTIVDNVNAHLELNPQGASVYTGGCGGANAPEEVVLVRVRQASRLRAEVVPGPNGETHDTLLYVRSQSCDMGQELGCDDDGGTGLLSLVSLRQVNAGDYYVFVDGFGAGTGPVGLDVAIEPLGAACADGLDNDQDGAIDGDDLGCEGVADDNEDNDPDAPVAACNNGADDDGDGLADYPLDPGCGGRGDNDEANPAVAPQCGDGIDNDGDMLVDFPADPGCAAAGDNREENPVDPTACNNGADDDGDRLVDLADPGCSGLGDTSEVDPAQPAACHNGVDDDGDGRTDFPFDPGCAFIGDLTEADPAVASACSNGVDDDGDNRTDFPNDPGCAFAADGDEADPAAAPACANGRDDDADGLIDFPNDPGCFAAGDPSEVNPAACDDDADNDDDGLLDLADPGCSNPLDDDETDPAEAPACADGLDNDGDGLIDFPADDGCVAAGAPREDIVCGEVNVPTLYMGQAGGQLAFLPQAAPGQVTASCGFNQEFGSETLIVLTLEETSHVQVTFQGRVRRYLRTICDDRASEAQCETPASTNALFLFGANPGTYFIFVEPDLDAPAPVVATFAITPAIAACNNGEDDDGDGLNDAFDPGCRDAFDNDETDLGVPPACDNGEDDDGDGQVDYPADPECRYAGAALEGRRCPGVDLDVAEFDGSGGQLVFLLRDGAGAAAGSCSAGGAREQVLAVTVDEPSTISVAVRDGDSAASVALYARRDCINPAAELACQSAGGLLTLRDVGPGTYYFFVERSAFTRVEPLTAVVTVQSTVTHCNDGVDSDGDGLTDLSDPGCTSGADDDEADPADVPACFNGLDDDGDGLMDFPNDFGCAAAGDTDESLVCASTDDVIEVVVVPGEVQQLAYDTTGRPNLFESTCGSTARSPDQPFAMVVPVAVTGTIEVTNFAGDSVLHIRRLCDDAASQVACDDDGADVGLLSRLTFQRLEAGVYYVIADGFSNTNSGPGTLVFDLDAAPAACADARDNDADGLIDLADPGCDDATDDSEFNEPLPACSNRLDDDVDSLIDLDDPGCDGPDDQDEFNDPLPLCSNRLDDDGDGRIDAADPGCDGPDDADENNERLCNDGADNDGDGLVDLADPGCTGAGDDDEVDPAEAPECSDGVDNDGDGAIDWPNDGECPAAGGLSELLLCAGVDDVIVVSPGDLPLAVPFDTTARADGYQSTCGGSAQGNDQPVAVVVTVPSAATFEITQGAFDSVLHVRSTCDDAMSQLACDDDGGAGLLSLVNLPRLEPGVYFVFVDGFGVGRGGPGTLTVTLRPL